MPRAGLRLGRGCFARGEGGVRDGPLASACCRPLRWGRPGCAGVRAKGVAARPGAASGRVSAHSQFCYLKFLFFFQICL
jgi:hypothetical protein